MDERTLCLLKKGSHRPGNGTRRRNEPTNEPTNVLNKILIKGDLRTASYNAAVIALIQDIYIRTFPPSPSIYSNVLLVHAL